MCYIKEAYSTVIGTDSWVFLFVDFNRRAFFHPTIFMQKKWCVHLISERLLFEPHFSKARKYLLYIVCVFSPYTKHTAKSCSGLEAFCKPPYLFVKLRLAFLFKSRHLFYHIRVVVDCNVARYAAWIFDSCAKETFFCSWEHSRRS